MIVFLCDGRRLKKNKKKDKNKNKKQHTLCRKIPTPRADHDHVSSSSPLGGERKMKKKKRTLIQILCFV
jgi:hypothetical protein